MVYCDKNAKILEWGSEEIALLYISPHDSRVHRYFPDFYIKVQENTGKIKRYLIEVKPLKQTTKPKKPKRQTKGCLLYTSPSPRDRYGSRMPSSA